MTGLWKGMIDYNNWRVGNWFRIRRIVLGKILENPCFIYPSVVDLQNSNSETTKRHENH
jgi:hypothetical protein